jgi:outer membrane protein assembly factor BamB
MNFKVLGAFLCLCLPVAAQQFIDPAPPKVEILPATAPLLPQKQAGLKFHKAPKALAANAKMHDWRAFLGPNLNATSNETPLLKKFGPGAPALVWEVPKGEGYAAPAIVNDRVLLFHRVENEEVIECLQAETGQRFWKFAYPSSYRDRYGFNTGPRCQPVSDGEWVYTLGAEGKLHCLKLTTGRVLWKRDILREWNLKPNFFGVGATPLLEGDKLIVNVGADNGPCVAAFDKRSGKMLWGAGKEWGPSYASPVAATVHDQRRIFVFAGGESDPPSGGLLCINPQNGKVEGQFSWRGERYESVNASSPVVIGNQVYISECYGAGGVLLDVLPDGSLREVWKNQNLQVHFMTPIYKDGYLYGVDGHGPGNAPLVCIEWKTGKEMWRAEPIWEEAIANPTKRGPKVWKSIPGLASLLLVDGLCLMQSDSGHLVWLDLNPQGYKELERVQLFNARETWALPSLSRGLLYIVQNNAAEDETPPRLLCYDLRG